MRFRFAFLALAAVALSGMASAAEPNTLTPEEKDTGWKLLFDGKTSAGWRGVGKETFPASGWVIEDGALKVKGGGGGDVVTTEEFENFEFSWEWKIGLIGNSGVKYNLPDAAKAVGFEYQMLDDARHPDGLLGGGTHQSGGLYDLLAPTGKKTSPVGEWNASRIVVNGRRVEHWLNGVKTVEFEMGSEALKALVAKSKFKAAAGFGMKKKSPILLQDHGDGAEFRSLKIRPL